MNHDDTPIETSEREARPWKPSDGYLPAGGDDEHPAANERSAADAIAALREAIERDGWQQVPGAVWHEGGVALIRRGTEGDFCARRGAQRIYLPLPPAPKD